VPSRREPSGFKGLWTAIAMMHCVFSTRAHAGSSICEIADKVREAGGHLPATWVDGVLHRLKHEGPARVLRQITRLTRRYPQIQEQMTYLRDPA
jgi:hypothetical protein